MEVSKRETLSGQDRSTTIGRSREMHKYAWEMMAQGGKRYPYAKNRFVEVDSSANFLVFARDLTVTHDSSRSLMHKYGLLLLGTRVLWTDMLHPT